MVLTLLSDNVLCLMSTVHARFLSDATHCPTVTSESVCRTTVSDHGSGLKTLNGIANNSLLEKHILFFIVSYTQKCMYMVQPDTTFVNCKL